MTENKKDYHKEPLTAIRIPTDLKTEAKKQAKRHGWTFTELIIRALRKAVDDLKKKDPAI